MRYKGYVYFIVYIALFVFISIRSGSSAMIYDYASKENLEAALIDNLTKTSNIGIRKGSDGGYWFFEPNTLSARGSSCYEGDLMTRVYARLDQYGYVIISRETEEDKISYRISPEDPTVIGGLPYAYGWGTPYSPGYPYQRGGFPGGWGTSPSFSGGLPYPWGYMNYPSQYGWGTPYLSGLGYGGALIGYDSQYDQLMANAYVMTMQSYFQPLLDAMGPMIAQAVSGNADLPIIIYDPDPPSRHAAYYNPFNPFLFY